MTWILKRNVLVPSVLDPDGLLGPSDPDLMLLELWKRHRSKIADDTERERLDPKPPEHVAILSFAGLGH